MRFLLAIAIALALASTTGCAGTQAFWSAMRGAAAAVDAADDGADPEPQAASAQALDDIRRPILFANRISLFIALGGVALAVGLRSYGAQEVGVALMSGGGVVWAGTAAMMYALIWLIWGAVALLVGGILIYLARNFGFDLAFWRRKTAASEDDEEGSNF